MEQDALSSTFCGSTVYAAPEILIAGAAYDPRWVDSWSCGIVLYAMLTAKMPFSRNVLRKVAKYRYVEGQFARFFNHYRRILENSSRIFPKLLEN